MELVQCYGNSGTGMKFRFSSQVSEFLERETRQSISNAVVVARNVCSPGKNWCRAEINVSLRRNCAKTEE